MTMAAADPATFSASTGQNEVAVASVALTIIRTWNKDTQRGGLTTQLMRAPGHTVR